MGGWCGPSRAGSMVASVLEVRDLTKRFGTNLAVDGLTFTARPGKVLGFLGPNGAGKTTTLRMLLGLTLPTSGTATVNGRPYRELRDPVEQVGAAAGESAGTRAGSDGASPSWISISTAGSICSW